MWTHDTKLITNLFSELSKDCDTGFVSIEEMKNILDDSSFIGEINPCHDKCLKRPDLLLGLYNIPLNSKIYISDLMCKLSCIELKNTENFIEFNYPINLIATPFTFITVHDSRDNIVKNFNYKALTTYSLEILHKLQLHSTKKFKFQIINNRDNLVIWRGILQKEIMPHFIF